MTLLGRVLLLLLVPLALLVVSGTDAELQTLLYIHPSRDVRERRPSRGRKPAAVGQSGHGPSALSVSGLAYGSGPHNWDRYKCSRQNFSGQFPPITGHRSCQKVSRNSPCRDRRPLSQQKADELQHHRRISLSISEQLSSLIFQKEPIH